MIQRAAGIHSAQRIAGIVKVLEQMKPEQRQQVARVLDAPGMHVSLSLSPPNDNPDRELSADGALFRGALRYYLDNDRVIHFDVANQDDSRRFTTHEEFALRMGMNPEMHDMMQKHMAEAGLIMSSDGIHLIQVQLRDGQWVSFGEQLPKEMTAWPLRVIAALALVLVTLGLVALLAVRWITQPLTHLADSALALGQDLQRPPLVVEGPEEVRGTLQAFNAMQRQIRQYVDERSRFLAAISHDLKTPITRLRLRCELLDDTTLQTKFQRDLDEMESLAQGTLEFMRDETGHEPKQALDINDLLETVQIDAEESGAPVTLHGQARKPFACHPGSLRRLIINLVDNAIKYGGEANIDVEDSPNRLIIRITDKGAGIPEQQLEEVLEPFTRLENSRSKETGGSGLGLSIAKNIAMAHGGPCT